MMNNNCEWFKMKQKTETKVTFSKLPKDTSSYKFKYLNHTQLSFLFILVYFYSCLTLTSCAHAFVPYSNNNNLYNNGDTLNKDDLESRNLDHSILHSKDEVSSLTSHINTNATRINLLVNRTTNNEGGGVGIGWSSANTKLVINRPINDHCKVDVTMTKLLCQGLHSVKDFPAKQPYFTDLVYAEFINISTSLQELQNLFPKVVHLVISRSPESIRQLLVEEKINEALEERTTASSRLIQARKSQFSGEVHGNSNEITNYKNNKNLNVAKSKWRTVRYLNLSWNELKSDVISDTLLDIFPNVELVDLSHNFVAEVEFNVDLAPHLRFVDISGNPLDCTSDLYWMDNHNIQLLHPDQTLCDLPPHQNKAKPIWKVIRLIKKVREECKVNCSCDIAYIWEQNHVIHSKTTVNCSNRGFTDFPDPDNLPSPTDTLDLSNNQINSIKKFVEDERYTDLHVMNLYLDSNRISSINLLEGSEWFYNFQVFTIRNNSITEVPVYVLENVFNQNKRILQIDMSMNEFNCECITVSTLKIWLLKYTANIKHIDEVRCSETGEQIRYMKREDWCTIEYSDGEQLVDILDVVSILLALAIVCVIGKVYYDYWNFKHKGKLPWLVRKM